jgi:hypothetical protein
MAAYHHLEVGRHLLRQAVGLSNKFGTWHGKHRRLDDDITTIVGAANGHNGHECGAGPQSEVGRTRGDVGSLAEQLDRRSAKVFYQVRDEHDHFILAQGANDGTYGVGLGDERQANALA